MTVTLPHDFAPVFGTLGDYLADRREASTVASTTGNELPRRLSMPTIIFPGLAGRDLRQTHAKDWPTAQAALTKALFVHWTGKALLMNSSIPANPQPVDNDTVATALLRNGLIICSEQQTAERLFEQLRGTIIPAEPNVSAYLEWASSVGVATNTVILTSALARRFHAPTGIHTGQIGDWSKAFGLNIGWDALYKLALACADGSPQQDQMKYLRSGLLALHRGADTIQHFVHISNDQAIALFRASEEIETCCSAAAAIDPLGIHERLRTGEVCLASRTADQVVVSTPNRLKTSQTYIMYTTDLARAGECVVTGMSVEPTTGLVNVALKQTKGDIPNRFFMVAKPYTGRSTGIYSQWTRPGKAPAVEGRQVPLDVLLASAPTG